ncbi:hypothetical protein PIB30_041718 [Stylosanthes scabra]|uniref:Kinesin-like protein n=1 Tax=Stylosanthes scabra TaxID=79078 RepID=A0ABU6XCR1_9FABA|nr:hypothetical protein [Stylosanthes scabra]
MSTEEEVAPINTVSVVEDILQKRGGLFDDKLASRRDEEASARRNEATEWMRKTLGVVAGRDLPAEPSEEDFRLALRTGIILCNVLNKIVPNTVPKVIQAPKDSPIVPDGTAPSVVQYVENVKNFIEALGGLGIPTFEASDLEKGGNLTRVVSCLLELKCYAEWVQGGKIGSWKLDGLPNSKPPLMKTLLRRNSEPSMMKSMGNSLEDKADTTCAAIVNNPKADLTEMNSNYPSLLSLVREHLSNKRTEEIPYVVESLLTKVMNEFEHRLLEQQERLRTIQLGKASSFNKLEEYRLPEQQQRVQQLRPIQQERTLSARPDEHQLLEQQKMHIRASEQDKAPSSKPDEHRLLGQQETQFRAIQTDKLSSSKPGPLVSKATPVDEEELKTIVHQTKSGVLVMHKKYQEEYLILCKHVRSLVSAASGYQKVLEENRKLYNQVQDLKGNIRVYCRVRPFLGAPSPTNSVGAIDDGSISIITPSNYGKDGRKTFNFNKCFGPTATQSWSFHCSGPDDLTEDTMGVNYRALNDLFQIQEQRKDTIIYEIGVQMLEIYNEQLTLEIRNKTTNGINVPEANLVPVATTADVINLMNLGNKNRAVGSTAMNSRSSRSHSCLTVHVQGKYVTSPKTIHASLHLVDLAGSERADKTEATGDRLKEAQYINKSLSALGDVIASLAAKSSHVPYRNSKLTQLLQDSLGGQAKTLMFVHISPEPDAVGETLSTLKFAERVATVELGAAKANDGKGNNSGGGGGGGGADVKDLKDQIASLKAALARKDAELESYEAGKIKSHGSTPSLRSLGSTGGARKLPRDDSSNLDGQNQDESKVKRRSLDYTDMDEDNWADDSNSNKIAMAMKRNDSLTSNDSLVAQWEADNKQYSPSSSPTSYNDYDEIEMATNDSEASEMNWQPQQAAKPTSAPSSGLKPKKPTTTALKSTKPETRSPGSSAPSPAARKPAAAAGSQVRKAAGTDVKKRVGGK